MKVYEIDGTFLGSIDSDGHPQYIYDYQDRPMAWIEDMEDGKKRFKIVWSTVETSNHQPQRAGQVDATTFSQNGKKAGMIVPENIVLDSDGNFWSYVGHNDRDGSMQKSGWMTPPPGDPFAVAAAAYFLTRSVFFFRGGAYGIYQRKPLWHDVDPRYFH
jgi:hypothetical protein